MTSEELKEFFCKSKVFLHPQIQQVEKIGRGNVESARNKETVETVFCVIRPVF